MNRPPEPILHVDLDAFYASVEQLKDPALAGRPVVVGGTGSRGVVSAASYEARRFGIHSAMPVVRARRLCPDAVFVAPDFESYRAYSNRFREILLSFTPLVEPISMDEAFLDVGGATMLFGEPEAIAASIRAMVRGKLGLVCSIGVAQNKFIAKVASDEAKPDGLLVVASGHASEFLEPLAVGKLWGAGEKTVEALSKIAVRTVADILTTPQPILARLLGDSQAAHLVALAHGSDDRKVVPYEAPRSISHEETFGRDIDDEVELLREILALSHKVGTRLRKGGYRAKTVTLKVRLASFTTMTRSKTLSDPTDVASDINSTARALFSAVPGSRRRVRLLGVAASGLIPAGEEQLALLKGERWGDVERTVDRIDQRFGKDSAFPAALRDRGRRGPPPGGSSRVPPPAKRDGYL
ncbi:MAG: DNA polymerase IV [Actinobacteria bacterium]|nr:DNA polymerase IV [Actinomycetota bacterium]